MESSCITVLLLCLPTKSVLLLTWILLWPAPCHPGLLSSWSYNLRDPLIILPQAVVLGFSQTLLSLFSTSLLLFLCFPGAFVFWFWTSPPSSSCFWSLLVYWSRIALLVMVFHSAYTRFWFLDPSSSSYFSPIVLSKEIVYSILGPRLPSCPQEVGWATWGNVFLFLIMGEKTPFLFLIRGIQRRGWGESSFPPVATRTCTPQWQTVLPVSQWGNFVNSDTQKSWKFFRDVTSKSILPATVFSLAGEALCNCRKWSLALCRM